MAKSATLEPARLPYATRSYVGLGLIFVLALGLAIWSWLEPEASEPESPSQARRWSDLREYDAARSPLRGWTDVPRQWPSEPAQGSLGGAWERVQGAPVLEGVLLEVVPLSGVVRNDAVTSMELGHGGELVFVPRVAIAAGEDPIAARRPCVGLPEHAEVSVAPDGSALLLRPRDTKAPVEVYRFRPTLPRECAVEQVASVALGERALGRPNAAGRVALLDQGNLSWFDELGVNQLRLGAELGSGAWWLDDDLIALLGRRVVFPREHEPTIELVQAGVSHYGSDAPRRQLDAELVFGAAGPLAPEHTLIDLRPVDDDTLLVLTEQCPNDDEPRPCLHRVRFTSPARQWLGSKDAGVPLVLPAGSVEVTTLGPVGPYRMIAIARAGNRAAWVGAPIDEPDADPALWSVVIGEAGLGEVERIDDDPLPESLPRISADGRVVVVESPVAVGELGEVPVARAFVLAPTPD